MELITWVKREEHRTEIRERLKEEMLIHTAAALLITKLHLGCVVRWVVNGVMA